MNKTAIKAAIDQYITNAVDDDSITPAILGARLKEMIDSSQPYKMLLARVSIDGGGVTATELVNDFETGTVTWSNPSTGVLRASIANNQITVNTKVITNMVVVGSTPYRIVPSFTLSQVDLNIQQWDGTQNSTPFITNQIVEIRVYD